jgi:hypothetical protein
MYTRLFNSFLFSFFFVVKPIIAQTAISQSVEPLAGGVRLFADPRINILYTAEELDKNLTNKSVTGSIRSAKGYRVMIYSGIDRAKANMTKADFMRRFPDTRIYMSYALPQYRIKVGDFSSREEANNLYRQLTSLYSPCMVVPDIVELKTIRKND